MCGEHRPRFFAWAVTVGSSPHVRGALSQETAWLGSLGIIPACAGSTKKRHTGLWPSWDHPRMCGEHWVFRFCLDGEPGSSPHVRGALYVNGSLMPILGIIPACAGSTDNGFHYSTLPGDHPRMCGEHFNAVRSATSPQGSSPHVRGAPHHINHGATQLGIIPACAGSTWLCGTCPDADRDHPRMCGEHVLWSRPATSAEGSSPHVRGARSHSMFTARQHGIIPACAGSTSAGLNHAGGTRDHPRMCGEHARRSLQHGQGKGSSPHVRGALSGRIVFTDCWGIIPACAGSTQEDQPLETP